MTYTEEEAREKWCPFEFTGQAIRGAAELVGDGALITSSDAAKCCGSDCMAWRWLRLERNEDGSHKEEFGYCGLAGKIE